MPAPSGYILATDEMIAIKQLNESQEDTLNDLIARYIPESEAGTALSGILPEMVRSYVVKVNKELQHEVFTENDFLEMQQIIEEQNSNAYEQIEYEISTQLKQSDSAVDSDFDLDNALMISTIIPLAVHHKDKGIFSHSMYINYGKDTADDEDTIVAASLNYVNLNGTVLFIYAFAPQEDLLWTQNSSLEWSKKILAANTISTSLFSRPVVIIIILLILVLLSIAFKKMKKS